MSRPQDYKKDQQAAAAQVLGPAGSNIQSTGRLTWSFRCRLGGLAACFGVGGFCWLGLDVGGGNHPPFATLNL